MALAEPRLPHSALCRNCLRRQQLPRTSFNVELLKEELEDAAAAWTAGNAEPGSHRNAALSGTGASAELVPAQGQLCSPRKRQESSSASES